MLHDLALGIARGLDFSVIAAAIGATVAAGITGYRKAPNDRIWAAAVVLLVTWVGGDGMGLFGAKGSGAMLIAWAIAGLLVGYVVPAVTGAYVGRLVHKGTGYLSAAAVALLLVPVLSIIAHSLSLALYRASL